MATRWTDLATWRGPTPNVGGPMKEQRGLVLHIAEGTFEGTIAWQKNPAAQVSSHFVVDVDGTIAQVVDVDVTAWTQILGNGHWLSVENAGHTPHALTDAQVEANAQLLARCHREFGVPLQIATSPDGRGLGHHSMGAESGVNWGHSDCPGPNIIAQKPAILARAIQIIQGDDMQLTDKITLVDKPDVKYSSPTTDVANILASTNYYVLQVRNLMLGTLPAACAAAVVAALPQGAGGSPSLADVQAAVQATVHAELSKVGVSLTVAS